MSSAKLITKDIAIIGGGVIGTTIARELAKRMPSVSIGLFEKEHDLGLHSSTRNSGVLHAGFYYSRDSLKTKFCKEGNRLMTQYCRDNDIPFLECGKLVVPKTRAEHETLLKIFEQGKKNEVQLELLSFEEAKKREPHLKVHEQGLQCIFSPNTKSTNPVKVMAQIKKDLQDTTNVQLFQGAGFQKVRQVAKDSVEFELTSGSVVRCSYFINAAGLYADTIAHQFNIGLEYAIFPMKGLFLYEPPHLHQDHKLKTLVYPVPPIQANYFLGVHFCLTPEGKLKVGPTAIPCFWREQYGIFSNFKSKEFLEMLEQTTIHLRSPKKWLYFNLLFDQLKKNYKSYILRDAAQLVDIYDQCERDILGLPSSKGFAWGKPGIRAQLIDRKTREIENDFKYFAHDSHLQILNVVSPGYTSAFALALEFADAVQAAMKRRSLASS